MRKSSGIISYYIFPVLFIFLLLQSLKASAQVNKDDFNIVGSANFMGFGCFQLTPENVSLMGAIWFKERLDLNSDFEITGKINLGRFDANGADGIAFVLQPLSINQGTTGGGLGYQGISPSLTVEFDTWQNDDPPYDHIALVKNGIIGHYQFPQNTLQGPFELLPNQGNAEDDQYRNVKFVWNAASKNYKAFYNDVLKIDYTGDIVQSIFNGNPFVYWGFTAATGGSFNNQRVCIDSFKVVNECNPNLPDSIKLCSGDAILNAGSGYAAYVWNTGETTQQITVKTPGWYKVMVTGQKGCTGSDSAYVSFPNASFKSIRYPNAETLAGISKVIQARNIGVDYLWSPPVFLSSTTIPNPVFNGIKSQEYIIRITDKDGCSVYDSLLINVFLDIDIYVPSAFTPNSDGKNDRIYPIFKGPIKLNRFEIYNRWGNLVFNTDIEKNGWNGIWNGIPQPTGTFVWVVEAVMPDNSFIRRKGQVTLIR